MKQREIKFRAWFSGIPAMVYFRLGENNIDVYDSINDKFTVDINDADSIMQYTGLKDKNGKEIYEGDIVYLKTNYHSRDKIFGWQYVEIIFDDVSFKAKNESGHVYDLFEETDEGPYCWSVIGNIYEHTEKVTE